MFIGQHQVGIIRPDIWKEVRKFGHIFALEQHCNVENRRVKFLLDIKNDYNNSVDRFEAMLQQLREERTLVSLHGWRYEASTAQFW